MPTKSNNTGGRGGRRPGAGRKKTAVKEKYENGNPGGRKLEVLDIPDTEGEDMPEPHEFLSARQHDGSTLEAADIYRETWEWLDKLGVAKAVSPQLLERYAMCSARWIQCEEMTTKLGYLSKHPTTGKPIPSPFINIGINYMRLIRPEELERLRKTYPNGTRVELIKMDDIQAPPIGTKGTVYGIDDTGSLLVHWDNGGGLNVIYGEDIVRKAGN